MIVVKVEMWPGGNKARAKEIGRMTLTNDGTSETRRRGNYGVTLMRRGTTTTPTRYARVTNFPRLTYPVWKLIRKALDALDV